MPEKPRHHGLRNKIIAWSFIPTAVIMLATALVVFAAYQRQTETLAIERDEQVTRLSASQLSSTLTPFTEELVSLARTVEVEDAAVSTRSHQLDSLANRLVVFDGGCVVLDGHGIVRAAIPDRPEIIGQDWSNREYFRRLVRSQKPLVSDIMRDGVDNAEVVALAVPIQSARGDFLGSLVGMFQLGPSAVSAFYGSIVKLRIEESGIIYLVDSTGHVIYHPDHDQIGADYSTQSVVQDALDGDTGATRLRADGRDYVAGYAPVPGTPWGLITEESWSSLNSSARGYGQFLVFLLALGVLGPALVVMAGVSRITQPINDLIYAAQEVARGDFGQTIEAHTGDEIEELANQFNAMSSQLAASYAQLEQEVADRTQALSALNAIAAAASRSVTIQDVLDEVLPEALKAMRSRIGAIFLLDEKEAVLRLSVHQGLTDDELGAIRYLDSHSEALSALLRSTRPALLDDLSALFGDSASRLESIHSSIAMPLVSSSKTFGLFLLASRVEQQYDEQDVDLLASIGYQIGVAIENAQLIARTQEAATIEERQRLARELHDAVTQTLFSASLIAEVLPRIWERKPEEARRRLEELRELSRGALAEMRTLLMELRPTALVEAKFGDLLRQLAEAFTGRARIPVDLRIESEPPLSPEQKIALYRIAQEAMNNIAKHSGATRIRLTLRCDDDGLQLTIQDDGRGFDGESVQAQSLGIGIMRERAASIGAQLKILSQPDEGTLVAVSMQCDGRSESS